MLSCLRCSFSSLLLHPVPKIIFSFVHAMVCIGWVFFCHLVPSIIWTCSYPVNIFFPFLPIRSLSYFFFSFFTLLGIWWSLDIWQLLLKASTHKACSFLDSLFFISHTSERTIPSTMVRYIIFFVEVRNPFLHQKSFSCFLAFHPWHIRKSIFLSHFAFLSKKAQTSIHFSFIGLLLASPCFQLPSLKNTFSLSSFPVPISYILSLVFRWCNWRLLRRLQLRLG